jgi:hypothetical protein
MSSKHTPGPRVTANGYGATIVPGSRRWCAGGIVVDVIIDDPRSTITYCTVPIENVKETT